MDIHLRHTLNDHLRFFRPEEDRDRLPVNMSAEETLRHLDSEHDRAYVATLPQVPLAVLEELLFDPSELVRSACFCNPLISEDSIRIGIEDPSSLVKAAAASSLNAPPDLLAEAAKKGDIEVLQAVALNPNTNPETLVSLLENEEIVQWVAENENLPGETLPKLWNESTQARAGVAANPACPIYLLIYGLSDPCPDVRRACARNLGVPEPSLKEAMRNSLRMLHSAMALQAELRSREILEAKASVKASKTAAAESLKSAHKAESGAEIGATPSEDGAADSDPFTQVENEEGERSELASPSKDDHEYGEHHLSSDEHYHHEGEDELHELHELDGLHHEHVVQDTEEVSSGLRVYQIAFMTQHTAKHAHHADGAEHKADTPAEKELQAQIALERAVIEGALANKNCPRDGLLLVLNSNDQSLKISAAASPAATPDILKQALLQPEEKVRAAAVCNPNADAEVLYAAMRLDPKHLEKHVANNPRATSCMLEEIYERNLKIERERQELGKNHMTPDFRNQLVQAAQMRAMVISHPNAGPELLNQAMLDPRRNLRIRALSNVRSTAQMLQRALNDRVAAVKKAAMAVMEKRGLTLTADRQVVSPIVMEQQAPTTTNHHDAHWLMPEHNECHDDHLFARVGR
jgi:hypothetical protein